MPQKLAVASQLMAVPVVGLRLDLVTPFCVALAWQYLWPSAWTTTLADTLHELMLKTPFMNVTRALELDWDIELEPADGEDEDEVLDPLLRVM